MNNKHNETGSPSSGIVHTAFCTRLRNERRRKKRKREKKTQQIVVAISVVPNKTGLESPIFGDLVQEMKKKE